MDFYVGTPARQRALDWGANSVALLGVHTNMCVLGRSFAVRNLVAFGVEAALVRDLTDSKYNPRRAPFVAHDEGTRLVLEHIERHWCATIDSGVLLAR